jgi:hypothetical protein
LIGIFALYQAPRGGPNPGTRNQYYKNDSAGDCIGHPEKHFGVLKIQDDPNDDPESDDSRTNYLMSSSLHVKPVPFTALPRIAEF